MLCRTGVGMSKGMIPLMTKQIQLKKGTVDAGKSTTLSVNIPCLAIGGRGALSQSGFLYLVNWDGACPIVTGSTTVTKNGDNITIQNNGGSAVQYMIVEYFYTV